ncbi:unnamed protein product [Trichobilharzia szidati]|nr:unnamed protein product [Trichobilharzia szidati]
MIESNDFRNSESKLDTTETSQFSISLAEFFHVESIQLAVFLFAFILVIGILLTLLIGIMIIIYWRKMLSYGKHSMKAFTNTNTVILKDNIVNSKFDEKDIKPLEFNQVYTRKGILEFSITYCTKLHTLTVEIIRCRDLQYPQELPNYNTRVTITLAFWDDTHWIILDHQQRKTTYINGLNPEWNEKFDFALLQPQLLQTNLIIEVYTCDSIGQDTCVGRLDLVLKDIDSNLFMNKVYTLCEVLKVYTVNFSDLGEMCIGLQYENSQYLKIHVIEIRNLNLSKILNSVNANGIDVTVYVILRGKIIKNEAIPSQGELGNLYFDRTVLVNLKKEDSLEDVQIYFQLRHLNQHGLKQVLGEISIGSKSTQNTGIKHWLNLCKNPLEVNIMWHIWNPVS